MKKGLQIAAAVFVKLDALGRSEQVEGLTALLDLRKTFGQPHVHSGLGIRKLTRITFECRASIALRFLFIDAGDRLIVTHLATHDEVRRLRSSGQLG